MNRVDGLPARSIKKTYLLFKRMLYIYEQIV